MAQAQITYIEIKNHTILEIAVWQNLEVFSVSEPPALQMGMTFVFNIGDLSLEPFLLMKLLAIFFECQYKLKLATDVCKILVHLTQILSDQIDGAHFDALPISLAAA